MAKLYQRCSACEREVADWGHCRPCDNTGFIETGLTLAQVDRLVAESKRFYHADGTFEVVEYPPDLIARRIACARRIADLESACRALPCEAFADEENIDAADFVDHCGSFLEAMRLARAALARATGEAPR